MFRSNPWEPGVRDDVAKFKPLMDTPLLDKLKIRQTTPVPARASIRKLVTIYWDCFAEEGIKHPIIGFEFAIDNGKHTPVCCKRPRYGPHESRVIMKQIKVLLAEHD